MNMKRLFSTPKKAVISAICIVAIIAAVSVVAVKSTLITNAEAKTVALRDAGVSETDASALRARLEFDDGRFQYEVDFYNNGTTYEYRIQAKDGDIIARDIEGGANDNHYEQDLALNAKEQSAANGNHFEQSQGNAGNQADAAREDSAVSPEAAGNQPVADEEGSVVSPEAAGKQSAVDGNRSAQSQETVGKQSAAVANNTAQPQKTAGNQPVLNGNSNAQPQEPIGNQPVLDGNSSTQPQGSSLDEAKAAALRDAGLSESDVTFKKTELDYDDGMQVYEIEFYTSDTEYDYKINASDKTVLEKSIELFQAPANPTDGAANSSNNSYIGVDRAKEIALNHANRSEADVRFSKAKLENDDGRVEYEIEFYYGKTEYEYTIDAVSGNIIEYDVDYD